MNHYISLMNLPRTNRSTFKKNLDEISIWLGLNLTSKVDYEFGNILYSITFMDGEVYYPSGVHFNDDLDLTAFKLKFGL